MTIFRAWFVGTGMLILAHAAWLIILQYFALVLSLQYFEVLAFLLSLSPLFAALVSTYFAPRKKVLLGMSMVLPSTILIVTLHFVNKWLGNTVDFPGVGGSGGRGGELILILAVTLVYNVVLCGLGSTVGLILAEKFRNEKEPA